MWKKILLVVVGLVLTLSFRCVVIFVEFCRVVYCEGREIDNLSAASLKSSFRFEHECPLASNRLYSLIVLVKKSL